MNELEIFGLPDDTHYCTSYRDGDTIVWKCPQCEHYTRTYNTVTGEMTIDRGGSDARHAGFNKGEENLEALLTCQNPN